MFLSMICKSGLNFGKALSQNVQISRGLLGVQSCSNIQASVFGPVIQQRYSSSKPTGKYATPSPYKVPKQKRYGYDTKIFTAGVLPRLDSETPIYNLKKYKPRDNWTQERALFGQNDYIDILGDGDIHPKDLIRGPPWLVGFKGNEMQRLTRRLRFEGVKLRYYYPTKYHNIKKRIKYLYKFYNYRRHKTRY